MSRLTYFSPADDCLAAILAALSAARHRIRVAMYAYDLAAVTDVLIERHGQGIDVHGVFDLSEAHYPPMAAQLARLAAANVSFVVGPSPKRNIMHHKYLVIDGLVTVSGSYNLSRAAARESNHLDIERSRTRAALFERDWQALFAWIMQNVPQPPTLAPEYAPQTYHSDQEA